MQIRTTKDVYRATLAVSGLALLLSLLATVIADQINYGRQNIYSIISGAIIPLLLAPPICFYVFRLNLKLSRAMEKMARLVREDSLTGLLNRRAFLERVAADWAEHSNIVERFAFVIDIDHFKQVNDTHGHAAGDAVIREIGRRASLAIGPENLLSRIGGEEFAVVLHTNVSGARLMAAQMCEAVRRLPVAFDNAEIAVTVSVGVARRHPADSISQVLSRADAALYAAKHGGRDRYVIDAGEAGQSERSGANANRPAGSPPRPAMM